jgi:hypothetical protein
VADGIVRDDLERLAEPEIERGAQGGHEGRGRCRSLVHAAESGPVDSDESGLVLFAGEITNFAEALEEAGLDAELARHRSSFCIFGLKWCKSASP